MALNYQTPEPNDPNRFWRQLGKVVLIIMGCLVVLFLILLGTCFLAMSK